jgi:transketolase
MRKQFGVTLQCLLDEDERLVLLLGDIGVFGFRDAFAKHPDRVFNIGILEQATVSLAAGLARERLIPTFHSIAPFVVERAYEQLKVDFGYQRLTGNFVSVGASYDYAALGCTHHCPGDIAILKAIPGFRVYVPGCARELDALFRAGYAGAGPAYYRLAERGHREDIEVTAGRATIVKRGLVGTVIVVGPLLGAVIEACRNLDVTVLYYTTVAPFDHDTLAGARAGDRIAVVEPFYEGTLAYEVIAALHGESVAQMSIGVPRRFLTNYGSGEEHDVACGLDAASLTKRLQVFFHE